MQNNHEMRACDIKIDSMRIRKRNAGNSTKVYLWCAHSLGSML